MLRLLHPQFFVSRTGQCLLALLAMTVSCNAQAGEDGEWGVMFRVRDNILRAGSLLPQCRIAGATVQDTLAPALSLRRGTKVRLNFGDEEDFVYDLPHEHAPLSQVLFEA